jgi:WD40 repeat protein
VAPAIPPELRDHPDYEVVRELGRGGMGVVYLARNKRMDRLEVLKVVNRQLLGSPDAAERFLREIRSAARLSHKNIVTAYAAPQAGELLLFAMEYVPGEDLADVVQARGPLPVVNACYYAHQVALGLQHAHEKGLVHRDIKPRNLILAREGKRHVVKILDFGLAKATREQEEKGHDLTGSGMMMGTPAYVAPEQARDAASADIRADIYSLGCTLYFLLAGRPPFQGKSVYDLINAHHLKEATPLRELRDDVPAEVAAVVTRMMAKEPAQRYQKPAEVAMALRPFGKTGLKPLPGMPPATDVAKPRPAPHVADAKTQANQRGGQDTAPPVLAMRETVIEGRATVARAMKQGLPPQVRPPPNGLGKWHLGVGVVVLLVVGAIGLWAGGVFQGRTQDSAVPPNEDHNKEAKKIEREEVVPKKTLPDEKTTKEELANADEDQAAVRVLRGHQGKPWRLAFSPNGKHLLSGSNSHFVVIKNGARENNPGDDNSVRLWNVKTGRQERVLRGHIWEIMGLAFCPKNGRLAAACSSTEWATDFAGPIVTVYNLSTGEVWRRFTLPPRPAMRGIALSSDGNRLIVCRGNHTLETWDLVAKTKYPTVTLDTPGGENALWCVAFTADRKRVLGGLAPGQVRLWNALTGKAIQHFLGHTRRIQSVAFSPDEKRMVSTSDDGTVRVWEVESAKQLLCLTGHGKGIGARSDQDKATTGVAWSANGRSILSGGWDGTVRLWDASTGKELRRFEGHAECVREVAISPDNRLAASVSDDKTVRIWKLP